jgi:hypothetical protein
MENDSHIIFSKHYIDPIPDFVTVDLIGSKAMGLMQCDPKLTPPFFVITSNLYKIWLRNNQSAREILQHILSSYSYILRRDTSTFIIRSSAKHETFDERGYYKSSAGDIKYHRLFQNIQDIWNENTVSVKKYEDNKFAIIVQDYIKPKLSGHLSNERRVSRNKTEWLIEVVNNRNEFQESFKFKIGSIKNDLSGIQNASYK